MKGIVQAILKIGWNDDRKLVRHRNELIGLIIFYNIISASPKLFFCTNNSGLDVKFANYLRFLHLGR